MTIEDRIWYWSMGKDISLGYLGWKPWPLPGLDSINVINSFKTNDFRYQNIAEFKRMYDIVLEKPEWDLHRGVEYLYYNPDVYNDDVLLSSTTREVINKLELIMGPIPKPTPNGYLDDPKLTTYAIKYVASLPNLTRFPYNITMPELINTSYYKVLKYAYLKGIKDTPSVLFPTIGKKEDLYSLAIEPGMGVVILFGVGYGIFALIFPPKNIIDAFIRIVGTWYVAWGVIIKFPPLLDILGWIYNLLKAIVTGQLLNFLMESLFYLIGKILELVVYMLLDMMQFIMWIPFIGWPFAAFFEWLKNQIWPESNDLSNPDGTKLIIYGVVAIICGIIAEYFASINTHSFVVGFLVAAPSIIGTFIYILFNGTDF